MTEVATLIESMCQGTATRADRDRLEVLLRDPGNRAEYLAASRLHSELLWRWHRGRINVIGPRNAVRDRRLSGARAGLMPGVQMPGVQRPGRGATAAFVGVAVGWLWRQAGALSKPVPMAWLISSTLIGSLIALAALLPASPLALPAMSSAPVPEAWITGLHEARWRDGRRSFQVADPVAGGTTLDLESGLVEIHYFSGATVLLEGPAVFQSKGRTAAELTHGRLTAKLETKAATGRGRHAGGRLPRLFTVHTPKASVHDLGTEFGVEVGAGGEADVHVFDGLVELAAAASAASPSGSTAVRLVAGDTARVDRSGGISASAGPGQAFVRSLPNRGKQLNSQVSIPWNDATAEIIYRDTFRGSGPLDNTSPASRGGVGTAVWRATSPTWGSLAASGERPGLQVEGEGHALLPFKPEPGYVYKLTVTLDVTAGGASGISFGMRAEIPSRHPLNVAAAGQRHDCSAGQGIYSVNALGPGPGNEWRLLADRLGGRQTRSVLLDTTGDRWQVAYHVGNRLLGTHVYPENPTAVEHIGLHAGEASVRGCVESFALARNKSLKEPVR